MGVEGVEGSCPSLGLIGLARILTKVEDHGVSGLMVYLDAYITMIPKSDGDATPLGQRPLSVCLPIVYRILGICSYGAA